MFVLVYECLLCVFILCIYLLPPMIQLFLYLHKNSLCFKWTHDNIVILPFSCLSLRGLKDSIVPFHHSFLKSVEDSMVAPPI